MQSGEIIEHWYLVSVGLVKLTARGGLLLVHELGLLQVTARGMEEEEDGEEEEEEGERKDGRGRRWT